MGIIVFDDGRHDLAPITDLMAVFEVRTGVLTSIERIERAARERAAGVWVPSHLKAIVAERRPEPVNPDVASNDVTLVNGRWLNPHALDVEPGCVVTDAASGDVIVARLMAEGTTAFLTTGTAPAGTDVSSRAGVQMLSAPEDIIRYRDEVIESDLAAVRLDNARVMTDSMPVVGEHPVEVDEAAQVFPGVVFDATRGAILIDAGATIRPGAVLCGPCAVGRDAVVVDRALIKSNTVIGPVCKVGGEVGGTIFQGYSNKGHEGHLGDSYVAPWVNLGAATTNSNLLNTYDEVSIRNRVDGPRRRSGLTFFGAIIGEHVKTAIGTRLMTGSVLGTGAMIASTKPPPSTVPPFAWVTDSETRTYRLDKFIETARRMMARRGVEPGSAYLDAIRSFHAQATGTDRASGVGDP